MRAECFASNLRRLLYTSRSAALANFGSSDGPLPMEPMYPLISAHMRYLSRLGGPPAPPVMRHA